MLTLLLWHSTEVEQASITIHTYIHTINTVSQHPVAHSWIPYSGSPSLVQRVVTIKVYRSKLHKTSSLKIVHDMFRLKLAIIRWSKQTVTNTTILWHVCCRQYSMCWQPLLWQRINTQQYTTTEQWRRFLWGPFPGYTTDGRVSQLVQSEQLSWEVEWRRSRREPEVAASEYVPASE
jgi:hypothetical protein